MDTLVATHPPPPITRRISGSGQSLEKYAGLMPGITVFGISLFGGQPG